MQTYRVCGLVIASTTPLPELAPVESRRPDFAFTLDPVSLRNEAACDWFHHWSPPDSQPWLLFGRLEKGYLLRFPGLADFSLLTEERMIRCYPQNGTPSETIRHLLLNQVVPLVLAWRGCIVLHGSAVGTEYGAIAFVAEPLWGKSTLASSFSEKGFPVLTDDCLLLKEECGRIAAIPSYPGLRLWPETVSALFGNTTVQSEIAHYTRKRRLGESAGIAFCTDPVPVRRIYFLVSPDETEASATVEICPIRPIQVLMNLIRYTYLLDVADPLQLRRQFEGLSRLVALPLFYTLAFRRDFSLLPEVHAAILKNICD
jgi:hypothetical protein